MKLEMISVRSESPALVPAFPGKVFALGVAAIVLMLAVSSFMTWRVGDQIRSSVNSQIQVLIGAERVEHYGTVLELSMKAVVATGDSEAATRYRRVQPELRKALNGLRAELQLAPNRAAALRVDRADLSLIAIEYEALDLVGRGNFREARRLIHSSRYAHLLNIYYEGIASIEGRASAHVAATEKRLDRYLAVIFGLSLASFAVLLIGWATVVRPARQWGAQLEVARAIAEQASERLAKSEAELKDANKSLFQQARIDPLTSLQTRLKFAEDMEQTLSRVSRYDESYSMIMCDIDYFKQYNDTYGHIAGDEILRSISASFKNAARTGDQLYRYGGEEFVFLLRTASLEVGRECAERFRAAVEDMQIPHVASAIGFVSVSMGVSQLEPGDETTAEVLLKRADAAMYQAKDAGRNRVAIQVAA